MNMKAVEMQIAVPRTHEAGRIQQEGQQRPLIDQGLLTAENIKQRELERQRSTGVDESANQNTIKREGNSAGHQHQGESSSEAKQEEQVKEHQAEHPFKGRHIDLSL